MNEAAKASNVKFGIMFNQRTNPIYARAREIVRSGQLGELKRLVWVVTNWYRTQATMTRAAGVPPGTAKAAASCSIRLRTISISGSGYSVRPEG